MPLVIPEVHEFDAVLHLSIIATNDHELIYIFAVVVNEHRRKSALCLSHLNLRYDVPGIGAFVVHFYDVYPLTLRILSTEDPYLLLYAASLSVLGNDHGFELRSGHVELGALLPARISHCWKDDALFVLETEVAVDSLRESRLVQHLAHGRLTELERYPLNGAQWLIAVARYRKDGEKRFILLLLLLLLCLGDLHIKRCLLANRDLWMEA